MRLCRFLTALGLLLGLGSPESRGSEVNPPKPGVKVCNLPMGYTPPKVAGAATPRTGYFSPQLPIMRPIGNPYMANPYMGDPYQADPYTQYPLVPPVAKSVPSPSTSTTKATPPAPRPAPKVITEAPAEAPVRLLALEFTVSGLGGAVDNTIITQKLEQLKEVRGASVKRKGDGQGILKVWYSEKDPVEAKSVIESLAQLGFKAVQGG